MGSVKDGLRGLFLAAALIGLFLFITILTYNFLVSSGHGGGEVMLIAFLMGFACARALAWFQRR